VLEIKNISKTYESKQAVKNISFQIPEGSIFGLLGPNGAGKTTLLRIINRIINADEGAVLFNKHPMTDKDLAQIGYLPEERGLYKKMKIKEQLSYFASLRNFEKADTEITRWLKKFDLLDWANKNVEDLSKGMQQKVQFINAVLHRPKFLILDEPFSGFDPVNAELVLQEIKSLKANGTTILYSTHQMESVEKMCDYMVMINNAEKVLDGTIPQIKNQFKTNTWLLGFDNFLNPESLDKKMKFSHQQDDIYIYKYSNISNVKNWINDLTLKYQNLIFLQEDLPSINDIFIKMAKPTA